LNRAKDLAQPPTQTTGKSFSVLSTFIDGSLRFELHKLNLPLLGKLGSTPH
jgi:hypothetical protein